MTFTTPATTMTTTTPIMTTTIKRNMTATTTTKTTTVATITITATTTSSTITENHKRYPNSHTILLRKQNSKQNFDFETRVGVDNDVCMKQNSRRISEFLQNFAGKAKF